MNQDQQADPRVMDCGGLTAVIGVIAVAFGFALLQRGLFIATDAPTASAASLITFDVALWGVWLVLSPAAIVAARRWPLRDSPFGELARHVGAAIG